MNVRLCLSICVSLGILTGVCQKAHAGPYASSVVGYYNLGLPPYDDPLAVLGKPATLIYDPGAYPSPEGNYAVSLVYAAFNTDPDENNVVTTVKAGGHIAVEFDQLIYDNPGNWYGKDFIVFGNAIFNASDYVTPDINMETLSIPNGNSGHWENAVVSVSQDGVTWYPFTTPTADNFAPTNAFCWDWINHGWGPEMDFTKPINPIYSKSSFTGLSVASAIDLYETSGGGTAFDLNDIPDLPVDPQSGLKWARYVKVSGPAAGPGIEVDAFAIVGVAKPDLGVTLAKTQADGERVSLGECVVSAATGECGPYCYIQQPDRAAGIRLLGRVLSRGDRVKVSGVMGTENGERTLFAMSLKHVSSDPSPSPLSMTNRNIGGGASGLQGGIMGRTGLNNVGLLVRSWGKVLSVDSVSGFFTITDGSTPYLKCCAPTGSAGFLYPAVGATVKVTGISSCETAGSGLVSVLRLRDQADLQ